MNDYLVPREIAEALGLVRIRKSTAQGLFLLSEGDLLGYGLQKAIEEGAIVISGGGVKVEPDNGEASPGEEAPPAETQEVENEPSDESETESEQDPENESEEEPEPESELEPEPEEESEVVPEEEPEAEEEIDNENEEEESI